MSQASLSDRELRTIRWKRRKGQHDGPTAKSGFVGGNIRYRRGSKKDQPMGKARQSSSWK